MIYKIYTQLLKQFFQLLYHEFAWAYDLVAWLVSFGNWQDWIKSILPFIEGEKILELGHGPGHFQVELIRLGHNSFGLDESYQMGCQAAGNINKYFRYTNEKQLSKLVRGITERLPYKDESFNCIIATFPTENIFNNNTISEVARVLTYKGVIIILFSVKMYEKNILKKGLALIYKITGQSAPKEINLEPYIERLLAKGLRATTQWVEYKKDKLLVLRAYKLQH
jgi:ubiquinone/menaquinone biosynthesis C-methylase UbiE